MERPRGQVRLGIVRPPDRMLPDRLRRAARAVRLALRAPALHLLGLFRHRRRRPPVPGPLTRLLVIRTDGIGDMALTTQALLDLRAHFRRARITVLAPSASIDLLGEHPAVDRREPLVGRRLPEALAGRFDLVIDFTPNESLRGALLARATRAPMRTGFRAAGRQVCFSLIGARAESRRHIIDLNRDLLDSLGVPAKVAGPALYVSDEERGAAHARLASMGAAAPRVVIHPGGSRPSQRWSPESFADVITMLTERTGAACVVLGGPGEDGIVDRIAAATPDALRAGPTSVREMMALIAVSDLFLGNASGPLHVASALGVPTVSVLGPSDPLRVAPRGPSDSVLRRDLPCSPCTRHRCWHHTCLRAIEPDEVYALAAAALDHRLPREAVR